MVASFRRALTLATAFGVGLVVGCGIEDAPLAQPFQTSVETLTAERTFRQGDVLVEEQVFLTNADRAQVYRLRARLTNIGPDLEGVRYEMVSQRVLDQFVKVRNVNEPAPVTLGEARVVDVQELGTLHSSQETIVTLEAREFGELRVQVYGRVATVASGVLPES
jgi:hypothetical protein